MGSVAFQFSSTCKSDLKYATNLQSSLATEDSSSSVVEDVCTMPGLFVQIFPYGVLGWISSSDKSGRLLT